MLGFLAELRRRRVIRVALAYTIMGWFVVQIADVTFEPLRLPEWTATFVLVLIIIGFPVAMVFAWAFDITPEGIQKTPVQNPAVPPRPRSALASVAVLPFRSLTTGSPNDYLSNAIPMELQNSLSRVHQLRVVSGQSSSAHAASNEDLPSIAEALDVQYVISGTVTESGEKIRIVAELDDAENDALLWSNTYDVVADDMLTVQQDIAESIVGAFGGERIRAEVCRANDAASRTELGSWQLVQKARAYLIDYKAETVAEAIPLIEKAIELDPEYAAAHAMLGLVRAEKTLNGISDDAAADRTAAIEAVRCAENLAPQDPVVLRAAAPVHAYTGNYRRSIELLRRAVELSPYDLGAWGYFGWPLIATGDAKDLEELQRIIDKLIKTAPKHPGYGYWLFHKSVAYSCSDQCESAVEYAGQAVRQQPRFALGWMSYANTLGRLQRVDEARAAVERCQETNPHMTPTYYLNLMSVLSDQAEVVRSRSAGLIETKLIGEVHP